MAEILDGYSPSEYARFMASMICQNHRIELPYAPELHEEIVRTPSSSRTVNMDEIYGVLRDGQPVGIAYCSAMITPAPADVNPQTCTDGDGVRGFHASVVIGYRRHNDACEVLIQNSWGTSCRTYRPELECLNGQIWVPVSRLTQYIHYYDYYSFDWAAFETATDFPATDASSDDGPITVTPSAR